ncbi:lectin 2 [Coprinellus micaceus]|uniref:Lectin 2 n=1 Tax=Coprinellus micaceus TaxID=71717 RepID=A0A4Y7SX50_COPMI|nr:lectin 2 [Coprinellus micaceus]
MTSEIGVTQNLPVPVKRVGHSDIIGFGQDGVVIVRNTFRPKPRLVVRDFGYNAGGWRVEKHVRLVGDTTGNGLGDIIGFGDLGVIVSRNNGDNTFGPPGLALSDFGAVAGWTNTKHIRYVADLRGTGAVDIVGFGDEGVFVSLNNGNGNFAPAKLALKDFGYAAGGWRLDRHLRYLADTTGDGLPDIVGFGDSSVCVAVNKGDGTFHPVKPVLNNFTYESGGWRVENHPRTVADLTGDGRGDLVGFANDGVHVALNIGNGTFQPPRRVEANFGWEHAWRVQDHFRFIADTTGDGRGDVVGFGDAGVWVARNNGDGTFASRTLVLGSFGTQQGWLAGKHPRCFADLTGDGAADIVGFGEDAIWVSYNDGHGNFSPAEKLTDNLGFNNGEWGIDKTIRWVADLFH